MILLILTLFFHITALGYEEPRPLKGIEVGFGISDGGVEGPYTYRYGVSNPKENNGSIYSFGIFLGSDPRKDTSFSFEGYSHCKIYFSRESIENLKEEPGVAVGSAGPEKWACGYASFYGAPEIAYSWGSTDSSHFIEPGKTMSGFILYSQGLPGIRGVQIDPYIEVERLPEEYNGNADKTLKLYDKVRWTGKTVGPKAPPKVFDPTKFIQYIESLLEESSKLGWVKTRGVENSLDKQLRAAEKQIGKNGNHPTQKMMEAFLKEVKNLKKKHLSPEGYALLYYNAQYFLDHLEVEKDHKDHKDHRGHKDRHKGKHGHHGRDEHHDHDRKHHKGHKDKEHDRHHHHQDNHDKKHHDDHKKGHSDKYHGRK